MFLLRCLFWLGLAFSQISQREGSSALELAAAASEASGQAAGIAANAVEQHCRAQPAACLALAAKATGATKTSASALSRDTLSAADRTPAWRGAHDKSL